MRSYNFENVFNVQDMSNILIHKSIHIFRQAKFDHDSLGLGSSQYSLLSQLRQEMTLHSKVVKIDSKKYAYFLDLMSVFQMHFLAELLF
jgi:hypothetical protein